MTAHFGKMATKSRRPAADSLGGLLLMIAFAIQGMPIGRRVVGTGHFDEVSATEQALLTAMDSGSTIVSTSIWATLYLSALLFVVFRGPQRTLHSMAKQWPLLLLLGLVPLSAFWSQYPQRVLVNSIHVIGTLALVFAASISWAKNLRTFLLFLSHVLGLNLLIHLGAVVFVPESATFTGGRWSGLTSHPNQLGHIAAAAIWANAAVVLSGLDRPRFRYLLFVAASTIVLLGTVSATSLVSIFLALVTMFFVTFALRVYGPGASYQLLLIFLIIASALAFPAIHFTQEITNFISDALGKDRTLTGRTDLWIIAFENFELKPFFGWSFDGNASVISSDSRMFLSHFHNGYIDLAIKGGLTALILLGASLMKYIAGFFHAHPTRIIVEWPFLALILIHNIAEPSFVSPRHLLWLILLYLVMANSFDLQRPRQRRRKK